MGIAKEEGAEVHIGVESRMFRQDLLSPLGAGAEIEKRPQKICYRAAVEPWRSGRRGKGRSAVNFPAGWSDLQLPRGCLLQ